MDTTCPRQRFLDNLLLDLQRPPAHPIVLLGGPGHGKSAALGQLAAMLRAESAPGTVIELHLRRAAVTPEHLLNTLFQSSGSGASLPVSTSASSAGPAWVTVFASLLAPLPRPVYLLLDDLEALDALAHYPGIRKPVSTLLDTLTGQPGVVPVATCGLVTRHLSSIAKYPPFSLPGGTRLLQLPFPSARRLAAPHLAASAADALAAFCGGIPLHMVTLAPALLRLAGEEPSPREVSEAAMCLLAQPLATATLAVQLLLERRLATARGAGALENLLSHLSRAPSRLSELARATSRSAPATRDYLLALLAVDLVERVGMTYRLADPVVAAWLRVRENGGRGTWPTSRQVHTLSTRSFRPRVRPENLAEID